MQEALISEGHTVTAARSVREAVEFPNGAPVGAVLVSGCPPDTDGLHELSAHARVIAITGHADLPAALAALCGWNTANSMQPISPTALQSNSVRVFGLRAAEKQMEQTARLAGVGELAASVAHELNNALGTVTLRLESLLAKTPETDPRRHGLEVVDQEVERMAALVGTLLEFTRAGRGQASTVDVRDKVAKTVELTHHHLARKGVRVAQEFAPGVPLIQADRQQLRQVLLNLFTNAADAMPDGGQLTLRVRPGTLPGKEPAVVITVADTGTGIPPELLPRVFDPFFTTKEEGKGTGLGLAICKRIVEQHQGKLGVESELGRGALLRVILPIRPDATGGNRRTERPPIQPA